MPRIYVGGIAEGINFPEDGGKSFHVDTANCNDLIIMDRKYFLQHISLVRSWALSVEESTKQKIIESRIK
jgi:hypothetical protein